MKRSFINAKIREAIAFLDEQNFHLPKWAYWSPEDWAAAGPEADEIRTRLLGWDITDFGSDSYATDGLLLFTIRNGELADDPDTTLKDYCEKLLLIDEDQVTPMHFHWAKMEDIINRGNGKLVLELWNTTRDTEELDKTSEITVSVDGIQRRLPAGGQVVLEPGESITLPPYLYHRFWGRKGSGMVLGGEVSRVNDDANDNRFVTPLPRFPAIEEDEAPQHLMCTEYPPAS